jgi:hypothetical protein
MVDSARTTQAEHGGPQRDPSVSSQDCGALRALLEPAGEQLEPDGSIGLLLGAVPANRHHGADHNGGEHDPALKPFIRTKSWSSPQVVILGESIRRTKGSAVISPCVTEKDRPPADSASRDVRRPSAASIGNRAIPF